MVAMAKIDVRSMALLSSAHMADDINQSFLPAMLPFFIKDLSFSHWQVSLLILAQGLSSSVVQPLIGYLADTISMPWLIAIGIVLAGGGIAALGFLTSLPLMFLAALISGLGVAMFHPEAARFANYVAGDKKASGMRWFTVGGNAGFAIGPIFAPVFLALWGLHGSFVTAIPVVIIGALVLRDLPRLRTFIPDHATRRKGNGTDNWPAFSLLSVFVIVRSMAYFGFIGFTALYVVEALHAEPWVGDWTLGAFTLAGIAGTLTGGPVADRVGRKPVLLWSTGLTVVLTIPLVLLHAPLWVVVPAVAVIGFIFYTSQAPMIVLGQEFLPNRLGLASGVTLGLAVSLGGVFSPMLGLIADHVGIGGALLAAAALAAIAFLVGLWLPSEARNRPVSGNPVPATV